MMFSGRGAGVIEEPSQYSDVQAPCAGHNGYLPAACRTMACNMAIGTHGASVVFLERRGRNDGFTGNFSFVLSSDCRRYVSH